MNRTSSNSKELNRKAPTTMDMVDSIEDEASLQHLSESYKPSLSSSWKISDGDGGAELSSNAKRRSSSDPQPPPTARRIKQEQSSGTRVGGFDPSSLAWLQRFEEIATIWLNTLVQQQHLYRHHQDSRSEEKQRIVDFCTRSLQQILSEGGFRSYTTPSYPPALYSQPLPPLQDLPCMVVTLKYWYTTLLSRCQHQTAVGMLPHRVLSPEQLSQTSVQKYVHACENEVKRWLRNFVEAEAKSKKAKAKNATSNENHAHVGVWMQQLHNKVVPSYSPVKPKRKVTAISKETASACQKAKVDSRMPSPTDVTMFDGTVAPMTTPEDINDNEHEDSKPAAKILPNSIKNKANFASSPTKEPNQQAGTNFSSEKARQMRGLILSLYHANKCPFSESTDGVVCSPCPVSAGCQTVKDLWNHIATDTNRRCCIRNSCSFSRSALMAEEALKHFGYCKKPTCFICGPVLAQMPKVKLDIAAAVEATQRQAAAIEDAILQVVVDLTSDLDCHSIEANLDVKQEEEDGVTNMDQVTGNLYTPAITTSSPVATASNEK